MSSATSSSSRNVGRSLGRVYNVPPETVLFCQCNKLHSSEHHGKMLVLVEDFGIVPILRYEFVLIMAIHFVFIKF